MTPPKNDAAPRLGKDNGAGADPIIRASDGINAAGAVNAGAASLALWALLLSAPLAARFCGVAESTWHKLNSAGQIPRARALGRRRLWSRPELEAWIAAGCPCRERWEATKAAGREGHT